MNSWHLAFVVLCAWSVASFFAIGIGLDRIEARLRKLEQS